MIAAAIEMHLVIMQQRGESLPVPSKAIEFTVNDTMGEELCTWVDVDIPAPAH
jgi:hypothetical protein